MPLLLHLQILRLHAAIVSAGGDRAALLGGLPRELVAGLPIAPDPKSQILRDLDELNRIERLAGGALPLRTWLETAVQLTEPRVEAGIFREALALLPAEPGGGERRKLTPSYPDETIRALSERIEAARERRRALHEAGGPTAEVDAEILGLRRQLREGGQLRAGDSLGEGRYLLLERIGRGGFAIVWRALDRSTKEQVAIKVLHSELAGDPIRRERFMRGARIMAELEHSAVVRVIEPHGEDGGYHYFAMELLTGGDLQKAVLEKRITGAAVLEVVLQVGDALAKAHAKGYVHRDVKPANILLDESGAPKLTDFDLVGGADTTGGTRTGAMGTVVYAAPELLHRPQDATPRADVYGLAMTAVFGLYGQELSLDAVRDAEALIRKQSPAGLSNAALIKGVLIQAVAWQTSERYADAARFCESLREAMSWNPYIWARPVSGDSEGQQSSDSQSASDETLEPGTVIASRYRILRLIGLGAMVEIYAAESIRMRRHVAIKLLLSRFRSKSAAVERFRREAKAAGSISSDHVTQVLDVEDDSEHGIALVYELLEGEGLIDRLKRTGPMPYGELHPIMEQVWMGLIDAHKVGIIHRNLKPSNIFLVSRPDGTTRAKILDFGQAKLPRELGGETLTGTGVILGTFAFMPPEQMGGAKAVDHRADLYATTTMIYYALAGRLPYIELNLLVLADMKRKTALRPLSEAIGEPVDPRLEAFIARGLAGNMEQRFATAEEALSAWRELRVLEPPFPRPSPRR